MEIVEREKYLQDKLNSYGKSLLLCLGSIESSDSKTRIDSLNNINKLIDDVETLCSKLNIKFLKFNNFCNALLYLKKYNLPKVNKFLRKHCYEERMYAEFTSTLRRIDNEEYLKGLDYSLLETIIGIDKIAPTDEEMVYERLISEVIAGEHHISMECFTNVIVSYTKMLMRKYIENPECYFMNNRKLNNEMTESLHGIVYLNKEEIENIYITGDLECLREVFHEIAHIKQYSSIHIKHIYNKISERELKEEILSSYLEGYYEDNVDLMTSEIEANIYSYKELIEFFDRNHIKLKDKNNIIDKIKELEDKMNNLDRNRAGKKWNVDDLFKYITSIHPELLNLYGKLKKVSD